MKIPQFVAFGGFTATQLRRDALAALVVTAIAIPESLAFAAIVGLPLQTGLYCALLAPVVFALLTSSKHLVVGADSATAALVASGAAMVATTGTAAYTSAVATLGILTGAILVIMAVARFGFLADLISRPVFVGFLAGIGVQLIMGKFPELLGIEASGSSIEKFVSTLANLNQVHVPTLVLSIALLACIATLNRRKLPGTLLGIAGAILAVFAFRIDSFGIRVVDAVDPGLPNLSMPTFSVSTLQTLLPAALAIAIVILAQSSAVIRNTASRFDEPVDDNRDLNALGFANIASAMTSGFAINGSPPRTLASEMNGGRTQMVNIYMAVFIGLILLFFTEMFTYLPVAALAVVICMVGVHLFDIKQLKRIARTRKNELVIALIALFGVALFGVQYGVLIAIATSIVDRLRRQYKPSDEILLRDGKLARWANERLDSHHKYRSSPTGVLAYRFSGSLFFENANYFSRRLTAAVKSAKKPVHTVVLDTGGINDIDFTAAEVLKRLVHKFNADDVLFCLAHVSPSLKILLDKYNLTEIIGKHNIYPSLQAAIFDAPTSKRSSIEMVKRLKLPAREYVVIGGGVLETLGIRETNDVDLVVSKRLYRQFLRKGWREYYQDDGKRVLSHNGYQVMETYVGATLHDLLPGSFLNEGVRFMELNALISCKRRMGRRKDHEDIKLIERYIERTIQA